MLVNTLLQTDCDLLTRWHLQKINYVSYFRMYSNTRFKIKIKKQFPKISHGKYIVLFIYWLCEVNFHIH